MAPIQGRNWPLEPDVLRRQAEFGTAEHRGGALGIVAGMRPHRGHIAPGALDRVVEENAPAPAGLEQAIACLTGPIHRLAPVPSEAGTARQRNVFAPRAA